MKTCQICTTKNESYADTCVACGEGSFALVEMAKAAPVASEADVAIADPAASSPEGEATRVKQEDDARVGSGKRRGR